MAEDTASLGGIHGSASDISAINFEIEELDDKEYDIPPVGTPPTLESILNEPDEVSLSEDDLPVPMDLFQDSFETTSIGSSESFGKKTDKRLRKSPIGTHGSLLRHVILRGVSSQLQSAAERVHAGKPTAMAVSALIAVGTFNGVVLVFDPQQALKYCLGTTEYGEDYGAVSALAFNGESTRLLCGYARGQLTMWDVTSGKLLRTITDAHPPQTTVLHVKFTDDPALALCSDSGGSVFELMFRRVMGTRTCESRCIFSGSRGEVCTLEPLRMSPHFREHSSQDVCLVALGTVTKVIVVTVRPFLKVWFTHPLKADADTLPLLCWQFVVIQVSSTTRVIDPVLAFGRQSTLYFYQVTFATAEKIKFIPLQKMQLNHVVQNFSWLNTQTIVTLDTAEHLHVIDVKSDEELEVLDIADVQLIYGSSHFKGLATGGNVSKAMAVAAERACYYSVTSFGSQLLLLGLKSVHVMTLRTWIERLELLAKQKLFPEALALALSFYNDHAKAVTGISGKKPQRQQLVSQKIMELLESYLDLLMNQLCPERGRIEQLVQHYRETVPQVVHYALAIGKRDFLFGRVFEKVSVDPLARAVYLESLEPHILDDRLPALTPLVAQEMVQHYAERHKFTAIEACLVRLDVACLDIHQVMTLCWQHGLYDAIIYIHNQAMSDYISPLEDLLQLLHQAISRGKQLTDEQIHLGNKILVYISCCLAGNGYPLGIIPDDLMKQVKKQVFDCITKLHSEKIKESSTYPYLKTLLHYDTREFLNVLALAFEESEFKTENGFAMRQRLVDILLMIMVQSEGFMPSEVGALFTFLARQMAKQDNAIAVNRMLFEQVLEYLTNPEDETRLEERQQALLELLQAGGLLQVDEEKLLHLVERAKFFRVCEYLYIKRRQFDKILSCYLQDPSRKPQVFYYISQVLSSDNDSQEEKDLLYKQVLASIEELIDIDNRKTSDLFLEFFLDRLQDVIKPLQNRPQMLYQLLQGIFSNKESSGNGNKAKENKNLADAPVTEMYIRLMCQFDPSLVAPYISSTDGYRLQETLEICKEYGIRDSSAFLLEKAGDIHGAFELILMDLCVTLQEVVDKVQEKQNLGTGNENLQPEKQQQLDEDINWSKAQAKLLVAVQLCQRSTGNMDVAERESLWFPLLDAMMEPQVKLRGHPQADYYLEEFKHLTKYLLNNMMGFITLPAILQKIMQNSVYSMGKFVEIRDMIMAMLETYNYEKTLLSTVANLLRSDLHAQLAQLCRTANSGYACRAMVCPICSKNFGQDPSEVVLFKCAHTYHASCLGTVQGVSGDAQLSCPKCQTGGTSRTKGKVPLLERRISFMKDNTRLPSLGPVSDKMKITLDPQQLRALEYLEKSQNTSGLLMLKELRECEQRSGSSASGYYNPKRSASFMNRDFLKLQLAPANMSRVNDNEEF